MMDAKLRKAIEAALDAGDAMFNALWENPDELNWGEVLAFVKAQHKAIKAARRALAKANQDKSRG